MILLCLVGSTLAADDDDDGGRVLFNFENAEGAKPWQTVNDGVMGGRSDGRFKINEDKNMEFFDTLTLENNGGFASVRARGDNLALKQDDVIVARIKGDGREYNINLYSQRSSTPTDSHSRRRRMSGSKSNSPPKSLSLISEAESSQTKSLIPTK